MNKKQILYASLLFIFLSSFLTTNGQLLPGKHPSYVHALHDLRDARWYLYHVNDDYGQFYAQEDIAIIETDAAIREITKAGLEDGKNIHQGVPTDVTEHGSRLLKALELLNKARADILQEEDNPEVRNLQRAAVEHLDRAAQAVRKAHKIKFGN